MSALRAREHAVEHRADAPPAAQEGHRTQRKWPAEAGHLCDLLSDYGIFGLTGKIAAARTIRVSGESRTLRVRAENRTIIAEAV